MVCLGDELLLTKARRIYEGDEDDRYRCERGHEFGMNWVRGPATEPQWPPVQELIDALAPKG